MIKIPKDVIISKIKEKAELSDKEIETKVKDKLDQLSGLISEEGALHIIANELGIKILDDPGKLEIKNIMAGMRNVELTGKVVKVYEIRHFEKNDRKGRVGNFLLGDQTGVIRIVAWNDKADILNKINEGDVLNIQRGYARENRGRMEVHLGDKTRVIFPENAPDIEVKERTNERKQIKDLNENEQNVEILGTIVQVFDPRFFTVDPETGKRIVEKEGKFYLDDQPVDKVGYSYVTNLFIDDGTENIRVVCWKNQTQRLFGMEDDEIIAKKDDSFEEIKNELLGKIVKLVGRTNKNEMFERIEFIPQLVFTDPDPEKEAERLNKELEKVKEEPEDQESEVIEEKEDNSFEDIESDDVVEQESQTEISEMEDETTETEKVDLGNDDIEEIDDLSKLDDI